MSPQTSARVTHSGTLILQCRAARECRGRPERPSAAGETSLAVRSSPFPPHGAPPISFCRRVSACFFLLVGCSAGTSLCRFRPQAVSSSDSGLTMMKIASPGGAQRTAGRPRGMIGRFLPGEVKDTVKIVKYFTKDCSPPRQWRRNESNLPKYLRRTKLTSCVLFNGRLLHTSCADSLQMFLWIPENLPELFP